MIIAPFMETGKLDLKKWGATVTTKNKKYIFEGLYEPQKSKFTKTKKYVGIYLFLVKNVCCNFTTVFPNILYVLDDSFDTLSFITVRCFKANT